MSRALSEVTKDAVELPRDQRLALVRILLNVTDIAAEPMDEVNAAWEEEIAQRIKAIDSGTAKGRPWEEVLNGINLRLAQ